MKISVVIPTYNRSHVLERAINSVLMQSIQPHELIVVDDGSTDKTSDILLKYSSNPLIQIIKTENRGVSAARNIAIEKSSGHWIALLDSDDEWLPNKLEKQVNFVESNPNIPLVHGEEIWIRNGKRVNQKKIHRKYGGDIFLNCIPLCLISPSASLIKKDVLEELGLFDEEFIVCEDYDLWLKLTSLYEVGFIEEPIINKYGGHEDQLSRKYVAMDFWRIKSLMRILEIRNLTNEQRQSVLAEVIKKGEILKMGYVKHKNMENYAIVDAWVNFAKESS
ncbi:MAG: glycosyltransferase [Bacteriovoracaceae bacterium]|nr:glycosyltransferase [Bacteriovoracaceae bacterium]